jgi:hypothetical protein
MNDLCTERDGGEAHERGKKADLLALTTEVDPIF